MVERVVRNDEVRGSTPLLSTSAGGGGPKVGNRSFLDVERWTLDVLIKRLRRGKGKVQRPTLNAQHPTVRPTFGTTSEANGMKIRAMEIPDPDARPRFSIRPHPPAPRLSPTALLVGNELLKIRIRRIAVPMNVPVIRCDELLEVHTRCVNTTVGMLMIERDLLLEIQTQGIGATNDGVTHRRQRGGEQQQGNGDFHTQQDLQKI